MRSILPILTAVICFGGATGAAGWLERERPSRHLTQAYDLMYLPSIEQARVMSLGFKPVMADWYWVKALQYFTDIENERNQYKNLGDLLELVVGLDPEYEYAYKFAGISLPFDKGRLEFVNTQRSTHFLEEGERRFPNNWQFPFYLGFNYLNYEDNREKAAAAYARAAKIPGAPKYLGPFAAKLFTLSGKADQALAFAESALENTDDPESRAMLENRIEDIKTEQRLQAIEAAAADFKAAEGRFPRNLAELVSRGFPHPGDDFSLDERGVASTTRRTSRMKIFTDPNTDVQKAE